MRAEELRLIRRERQGLQAADAVDRIVDVRRSAGARIDQQQAAAGGDIPAVERSVLCELERLHAGEVGGLADQLEQAALNVDDVQQVGRHDRAAVDDHVQLVERRERHGADVLQSQVHHEGARAGPRVDGDEAGRAGEVAGGVDRALPVTGQGVELDEARRPDRHTGAGERIDPVGVAEEADREDVHVKCAVGHRDAALLGAAQPAAGSVDQQREAQLLAGRTAAAGEGVR